MEPIYIVLIIVIVIWIGIFWYMLRLDKEVKKLNEELKKLKNDK